MRVFSLCWLLTGHLGVSLAHIPALPTIEACPDDPPGVSWGWVPWFSSNCDSLWVASWLGARGSLVGRAARLHQTAVYQWVSGGEEIWRCKVESRIVLCILGWQVLPWIGGLRVYLLPKSAPVFSTIKLARRWKTLVVAGDVNPPHHLTSPHLIFYCKNTKEGAIQSLVQDLQI